MEIENHLKFENRRIYIRSQYLYFIIQQHEINKKKEMQYVYLTEDLRRTNNYLPCSKNQPPPNCLQEIDI